MPTGWAFSIWGIIYLSWGFFVVYQVLPRGGRDADACVAVRPFAFVALIFNIAWLYLFSFEVYWIAWIAILSYAVALLKARASLNIDWTASTPTWTTKLLVAAPFSLNAAWVIVASFLQIGVNSIQEGWLASDDFCVGCITLAVMWACYVAF